MQYPVLGIIFRIPHAYKTSWNVLLIQIAYITETLSSVQMWGNSVTIPTLNTQWTFAKKLFTALIQTVVNKSIVLDS